jgi:hypothetical protein
MAATIKDGNTLRKNSCKAQKRETLRWTVCVMWPAALFPSYPSEGPLRLAHRELAII